MNLFYSKKYKDSPLLYLCNFDRSQSSFAISDKLIIDNSHYKYNFRNQIFKQEYPLKINDIGASIILAYSEILDFIYEESLTIRYIISAPSLAKNLKFVSDSEYSKCDDINGLKKYIVPLTHFIGYKNEFYYLSQYNNWDSFLHYESSPIKVIISENILVIYVYDEDNPNNGEKILIGKNNFIFFVTDYIDEKNIFDISDIEEKTGFNNTILDENNNSYNVICRLWKPLNENIRIFCKLKDDWNKYLEKYLINNITEDYMELVRNYNLSNIGI